MAHARAFPTAVIENLQPLVDGGRYPVKRVVGEDLVVEADVFKDGHDIVAAALKWRLLGETRWHETPMTHVDNDRWRGVCTVYENATYEYTVEAWTDTFRGWQHEFAAKFEAGIANLRSETLEGAALLDEAADRADDAADAARLRELAEIIRTGENAEINEIAHSGELEVLMATYPDRATATQYAPAPRDYRRSKRGANRRLVRIFSPLRGRPRRSRFDLSRLSAAGRRRQGDGIRRDLFPADSSDRSDESQGPQQFRDLRAGGAGRALRDRKRIWRAQGDRAGARHVRGFRLAGKRDPEPRDGDRARFRDQLLARSSLRRGSIPEWFYKRPDGTIKYAENPPKKYEDIYPLNFRCENWRELWEEMKSIILFWAEHGVRIFRVDNPHTKPVAFWEYLISGVRASVSGCDFSFRGFHQAEDDEGAGQGRLHPELHLFHLAQHQGRS